MILVVLTASPVRAEITTEAPQISQMPTCGRDLPVTDPACQKEFNHWQTQEKAWRENRRLFANYVTHKGVPVRQVRRPDPPLWVARYCEPVMPSATSSSFVCYAYDDYLRYDWTQHVEGPQAAITFSKRVAQPGPGEARGFMDYILRNLHYDGAWTNSESGPRFYGLFGTHLTLAHASRVYLWGPPGMLLLRRPDGRIEVKMTWGVDIFVADVPVPWATGYRLPLFFSIAKVFGKSEETALQNQVNTGINMIGFSVTLKR